MGDGAYANGFYLFFFFGFVGAWLGFAFSYPPLGIFFGWIPAIPIGMIIGGLWPVVLIAFAAAVLFNFKW